MTDNENIEYGIDSRYKNVKEQKSEATALMEARLNRMKNLSKDQTTKAKLVQLKLKMEEYLEQPVYDDNHYFSGFLKLYIDAIYQHRSTFAKDIDISAVALSQVINRHREPNEEFIKKLMIHSEKVYKNISSFHKKTWYQIFYQEKICNIMSSQEKWRPELESKVVISEVI